MSLDVGRDETHGTSPRMGLTVTALDYSGSAICQMNDAARQEGLELVVSAIVHDVRHPLPFPNESFDSIYSHMLFTMELSDEEVSNILADCRRVLRPGGLNIWSVRNDHDPHFGKFEPIAMDTWKNPNGFVVHLFSEDTIRRL